MSIMQSYRLAQAARVKLAREASRADHDLRLLVGHANLLDGLMMDLAEAEQDQERWFNQTVQGATAAESTGHVQWADTVVEEPEDDWAVEDAYSDSSESEEEYDEDEEVETTTAVHARRATSPPMKISVTTVEVTEEIDIDDEEDEDDEDEEDYAELSLVRTSTSSHQPPELLDDSEDDSDDDSAMPPSPPQPNLDLSEQDRKAIATTSFYRDLSKPTSSNPSLPNSEAASFFDENYYLPQRVSSAMIESY